MTTFAIRPWEEPTELAWDRLALATRAGPFVRPGWITAWAHAFDHAHRLRVATLHRHDALVAVLPLIARGRRLCSPTNFHTPGFDAVAAQPQDAAELVAHLRDTMRGRLDLRYLPDQGILARALPRIGPYPVLQRPARQQPYVSVGGSWDEYRDRQLGSRRRRDIDRRWRRLRAAGDIGFTAHDGSTDLDNMLRTGFALESSGWKGRAGTAIASRPETAWFYREVARWAAASGILQLFFLHVNGRPVAFCYALQQGETLYCVKAGYDENDAPHSPGALLLHRILQHGFVHPEVATVELLGEDDPYKARLAHGANTQLHACMCGDRALPLDRTRARARHHGTLLAQALLRKAEPLRHRLRAASPAPSAPCRG